MVIEIELILFSIRITEVISIISFSLFSWNIQQGGGRRLEQQIHEIDKLGLDIIVLQELTIKKINQYRDGLERLGYRYQMDTFNVYEDHTPFIGPRRYGLLIASKWPITKLIPVQMP